MFLLWICLIKWASQACGISLSSLARLPPAVGVRCLFPLRLFTRSSSLLSFVSAALSLEAAAKFLPIPYHNFSLFPLQLHKKKYSKRVRFRHWSADVSEWEEYSKKNAKTIQMSKSLLQRIAIILSSQCYILWSPFIFLWQLLRKMIIRKKGLSF